MSEEKQYENKGAIYLNTTKKDKQPDYRGKINIAGQDYRFSGWIHIIDNKETIRYLLMKEEDFIEKMKILKSKYENQNENENENENRENKDNKLSKTEIFDPVFDDIFKGLDF